MSKALAIIEQHLKPGDMAFLDKYRGREIDFFLERGRLYPEVLEKIFLLIYNGEADDLVIIGPRGGGKTMVIYDAATARFMWKEDDVFAIGGSKEQAINGFKYSRQILNSDVQASENVEDCLKGQAVGVRGNWMRIAAASTKGVRGPHPGDPHPAMGWVAHGGLLIKDERDEMDDDIADAADFTMDVAEPSTIVTSSTMHRDDGGGIAAMAEDAEARGAVVVKYDVFDVCEVCKHDCAKCPGGFPFAGSLYGATPVKGKLPNGAPLLPKATAESNAAWDGFKSGNAWPVGEPAYCLGRAKMHRPGHYKMPKIFRAYKRSRHREIFEVELCCRKRKGARRIVDGAALDRCLNDSIAYCPGYDTPIITIDWGFKGWCVPILLQGQMDNTIAILDCRFEHMTSVDGILAICEEWQRQTGATLVYADSSHPYENLKMVENGFDVTEVVFGKDKELGAGWVRGIVEKNQLRIPGKILRGNSQGEKPTYIFYNDGIEQLFDQTKSWQRDKNGKIVKKNDHGPDSLSCAARHFTENTEWEPEFLSSGQRDSFKAGGA